MILGLDAPTSGTATANGRPMTAQPAPLRTLGALLDAGALLPSRSAYHHLRALAASNGLARGRVDAVLEEVGLAAVARRAAGSYSRHVVLGTIAIRAAIATLVGSSAGDEFATMTTAEKATFDPLALSLRGYMPAQVTIALLGGMSITAEYGSRTMVSTLTAVPHRSRVLAAKAVVLGAVTFLTGLLFTFAGFLAGQAALQSGGAPVGFAVTPVTTGAEALAAVQQVRPDLIVLDVMLPDFAASKSHGGFGGTCRRPLTGPGRPPCDPRRPHRPVVSHRTQPAAGADGTRGPGAVEGQLLDLVRRYDFGGDDSIVASYVSYLRRKMDTREPKLIHTVRGTGYMLRRPHGE